MKRIQELMDRCKASVHVEINQHKAFYESAEKYLDDCNLDDEDLPPKMRQKMIAANCIVQVQFYPHTPVGFYSVWDCDLECAIDRALAIVREVTNA